VRQHGTDSSAQGLCHRPTPNQLCSCAQLLRLPHEAGQTRTKERDTQQTRARQCACRMMHAVACTAACRGQLLLARGAPETSIILGASGMVLTIQQRMELLNKSSLASTQATAGRAAMAAAAVEHSTHTRSRRHTPTHTLVSDRQQHSLDATE
jgi:hypothetical protein